MKKRYVKLGAALCASLLLACPGLAEEKHLGNLIYVPAMTVQAQSGTYALRVEGLSLEAGSDDPVSVQQLSGAEFGVYVVSSNGEVTPWANPLYPSEPMRIRTGEGETRFSLPRGTEFFLRQESAPEGYRFDGETLIPVTGEELVVRNTMAGQMIVSAVDTLGSPVAGMQFTVTAQDGTVTTLTADENGEAVLACEQAGAYTVSEAALPEGVFAAISMAAGRDADVLAQEAAGLTVQVNDASRTRVVFEHPASGAVQLNMTLAVIDDAGQTVTKPLAGVRMEITGSSHASLETDATGGAQASLLEGEYHVSFSCDGGVLLPISEGMMIVESGATTVIELTAVEPTGRVVLTAEASKAVSGGSILLASDATGEEFGPYAMDSEGVAVSELLAPGLYYMTMQAPERTQIGAMTSGAYSAAGDQELMVEVAAGQAAQVSAQLLQQEKQFYEIVTAQVGEDGKTHVSAVTTVDALQLVDANGAALQDISVTDGYVAVEALTGDYTLRMSEKEAKKLGVLPESIAFALPSQEESVTFPSSSTRLILTSVDENGLPVEGAVYLVTDGEGGRYEVATDANGEAVTPLIAAGDVRVATIHSPLGHAASAEQAVFASAGSALRVQMMHESYGMANITLNLQKLDERGAAALAVLPGAVVEIRKADGNQEVVAALEAGEDGQVSCALEAGEYTAQIDAATAGDARVSEAVRFAVANMEETGVKLLAYDAMGGVRVALTGGALTQEEMAQVRFELTDASGDVTALNLIGDAFYAGGLSAGEYTLRQTQMPQGYTLGSERSVSVTDGELTQQNMPLEEYAVLTVNKTGLTFNDRMQTFVVPLTGQYGVYTSENGEMKPYPSEAEQMTVWSNVTPEQIAGGQIASLRLPASIDGTAYYIRELTDAQGFAQDDEYREVVLTAGEPFVLESTVSSDRGFFSLDLVDALSGGHVSGAEFALLDSASMEPVLTFEMGEEPYRNPMAVAVGTYVLRQTKAAPGYALSEDAQSEIVIEPYLTQGGLVTQATLSCATIPDSEQMDAIADLYAAQEQGLTLVSVDTRALNPGETLILPQVTLTVGAAGAERSDVKSVMLDGTGDAVGGQYMARVEYCLADGGWQPSDARLSAVLSGPAAVSLSDVEDDISAVRVTYLNAQTGEELARDAFTPGRVTLDVRVSAEGAVNMEAKAEFTGKFAYTQAYFGELQTIERSACADIAFLAQGNGVFETAPAGRDGRITGMAFFDTDGDGVADSDETSRYAGMTVSLLSANGEELSTCRTDGQGMYSFDSLSSGVYTVQFDAGADVVFSSETLYSAQKTSRIADTRYGQSGEMTIDAEHTDYVVNAGCLYAASLTGAIMETTAEGAQGFGGLSVEMRQIGADEDEEPVVVVTGETGEFAIGGILPGRYDVSIALPEEYLCADAPDGVITREVGFAQGDKQVFGLVNIERGASVEGIVRIDDNGDGVIDGSAQALEGVAVKLLRVADGHTQEAAQAVTGADGAYRFDMLPSGTYSVLFELPQEWAFTRYGEDSLVYGAAAASGSTESFALMPGQALSGVDAGATIPASLTVLVFKDTQFDGQKGTYEEMLADASVTLIRVEDGNDVQEHSGFTDENGQVVFDNVSPGEYVLAYQLPDAWRATRQVDPQTTNYPVSCVPQSTLSAGRSGEFTLAMGQKDAKLYIGAMLSGSISGVMYYDDDADASQSTTELGVSDMLVELLDSEGSVLAQMNTDGSGAYAFEGLAPARYRVRFTAPQACGFAATEHTMVRGSVQLSDDNVAQTRSISIASGASVTTANAGVVRLGTVSGTIWEDSNADLAMDEQERRLSQVEVALMDGAGRVIQTTDVTDENGVFVFENTRPGQYMLRVTAPDGYVFSGARADGVLPVDHLRENRAYSSAFTLLGGAQVDQIGFGLFTQGTIRGLIWQDEDFDAAMTGEETGLRSASFSLVNGEGETVATETSVRSGEFAFEALTPGEYTLQVTLPEGYVFTRAGGASMIEATGERTAELPLGVLAMGQNIDDLMIGALRPAAVGGVIWMDSDDDGRRQANGDGMMGVGVTLISGETLESVTAYTDETGAYRFDGVLPGSYTLSVELEQGYAFAKQANGTRRVSRMPQADSLTAETEAFDVVSGVDALDMDVGVVGVGTIDGLVWEDSEYDGRYDRGEQGVANALIELIDAKSGSVARSAYSGEDGAYLIDFVRTGEYTVRVTLPDGMIFTCEGESAVSALDTDTGSTQPYALKMGEGIESLDVGAIVPATVGGRLYIDENENGAEDADEAGLRGAVITMMQGGTVVETCQTDANGEYAFDTMRPGKYRVRVTLPEDTLFARQSTLTLADPDALEGETAAFELAMGEEKRMESAAAVLAASISGRAWSDDNADGRMGASEPALEGTQAELLSIDEQGVETVVASAKVDDSGAYAFKLLRSGTYAVRFILPQERLFADYLGETDTSSVQVVPGYVGVTERMTLAMGDKLDTVNIGGILPGSIGDTVWLDENGNGLQDYREPLVPGVSLSLLRVERDGTIQELAQTVSDEYGYYRFGDLRPGTYIVRADVRDGNVLTVSFGAPLGEIDSDVNPDSGMTAEIELSSGQTLRNIDIGFTAIGE